MLSSKTGFKTVPGLIASKTQNSTAISTALPPKLAPPAPSASLGHAFNLTSDSAPRVPTTNIKMGARAPPTAAVSVSNNDSKIFMGSKQAAGSGQIRKGLVDAQIVGSSLKKETLKLNTAAAQRKAKRKDVESKGKQSRFASKPVEISQGGLFGIGMVPKPVSNAGGGRSGLMNLQMNYMDNQQQQFGGPTNYQDYRVDSGADMTQKQVIIQDNFIDSQFTGNEELNDNYWNHNQPNHTLPSRMNQELWATGLDRELDFRTDLISSDYSEIDSGVNRIASNYNPPTKAGQYTIREYQNALQNGYMTLEKLYDQIRDGLASHFNLPQGTGIFIAPSDVTAQYVVLMIMNALHSDQKRFHNIITGQKRDEFDINYQTASKGQFISSEKIPLLNWDGDDLEETEVPGLPKNTSTQILENREDDEFERNYFEKLNRILFECEQYPKQAMPIIQSMGPLDKHMEQIWWNKDQTQNFQVYNHIEGRLSKDKVQRHLMNGDLFVFNGSDYYRGPLQCAAVFVPPSIMANLQFVEQYSSNELGNQWFPNNLMPSILNGFFGKNDIPKELLFWRNNFEDLKNPGLALRWSAALVTMNEVSQYNEYELDNAEIAWKQRMSEIIKSIPVLEKEHYVESLNTVNDEFQQEFPYNSITISVQNQGYDHQDESYLSKWELALVQYWMSQDMSQSIDWQSQYEIYKYAAQGTLFQFSLDELRHIASQKIFIAPPIQKPMHENNADGALKISLGHEELVKLMNQSQGSYDQMMYPDCAIIYKLAILAFAFPQLVSAMNPEQQQWSKSDIRQGFMDAQMQNFQQGMRGWGGQAGPDMNNSVIY